MISKCICDGSKVDQCIDLGSIPLVNNFKKKIQLKKYSLSMGLCRKCKLFQIQKNIEPKLLFNNYAHVSSGSKSNLAHIKKVFNKICKIKKVNQKTKILEIGCNDGSLLNIARKKTKKIVGVDPAKNLVKKIKNDYLELIPDFFNKKTGDYLISKYKKFDVIIALNVIPHTINVREIIENIGELLSDDGIFFMEGAYFYDTIFKGKFDTIYHEHVSSFTLYSLINLFNYGKLKVHYAGKINTQGGSIRVIGKKKTNSKQWKKLLAFEKKNNVTNLSTYRKAGKLIRQTVNKINKLFSILSKKEKVILLGAPARGVVISHVCNLDQLKIDFAIDDSKTKFKRYFPGFKFKVFNWKKLKESSNTNFFLLSWNYKRDMVKNIKKEKRKFNLLEPFPEPKITKY